MAGTAPARRRRCSWIADGADQHVPHARFGDVELGVESSSPDQAPIIHLDCGTLGNSVSARIGFSEQCADQARGGAPASAVLPPCGVEIKQCDLGLVVSASCGARLIAMLVAPAPPCAPQSR